MLNSDYTFEKYTVALPDKEGDVMLNGSSSERSQSFACSLTWLWYLKPECLSTTGIFVYRQVLIYG